MNITVTLNLLGIQLLDVKQSDMALSVGEGTTIGDLIELIDQRNPDFKKALFDEKGNLSKQIVLFLNGRNMLHLDGMATELHQDDVVNIIPAIAGG